MGTQARHMQLFNFPYQEVGYTRPSYGASGSTQYPSPRGYPSKRTNHRRLDRFANTPARPPPATRFDSAPAQTQRSSRSPTTSSASPTCLHPTYGHRDREGPTQLLQLFSELNDQHCAHTGRLLPRPSNLTTAWTADDIRRYFNTEGQVTHSSIQNAGPVLSSVSAAVKLQAAWRGWTLRKSKVLERLRKRKLELKDIMLNSEEQRKSFEPWVFEMGLTGKKISGVPVQLIEYEEMLLREQLKLDGMQSSGPAADALRHLRRKTNRELQVQLNQIDACREQWKQLQTKGTAIVA